MHVLVQRAKLLLSLRGVVLAQKVRKPSLTPPLRSPTVLPQVKHSAC